MNHHDRRQLRSHHTNQKLLAELAETWRETLDEVLTRGTHALLTLTIAVQDGIIQRPYTLHVEQRFGRKEKDP